MQTITMDRLKDKLASSNGDTRLLDVRTYPEYRAVHVRGARLMPLDQLDPAAVREAFPGDEPVYVLCKSGDRSKQAVGKLEAASLNNVVLVEGGTDAALSAGVPVERGKAGLDLMRQVQIVAGSLTFIGTVLGATVSPWFLVVPGFIGAGLTFAGSTGWCGMALVLGRLPWNRAPAGSCGVSGGSRASCAA